MKRRPWSAARIRAYRTYQREIAGDIESAYREVWNLDRTEPARTVGGDPEIKTIDIENVRERVLVAVGK